MAGASWRDIRDAGESRPRCTFMGGLCFGGEEGMNEEGWGLEPPPRFARQFQSNLPFN